MSDTTTGTGVMPTEEDVVTRIVSYQKDGNDPLGFRSEALLMFTSYDALKPSGLIKDGVTKEEWDADAKPFTPEAVIAQMKRHIEEYGWEKARDQRGISAGRTIEMVEEWLWIIGALDTVEGVSRATYGTRFLFEVSDRFEFDIPEWATGVGEKTESLDVDMTAVEAEAKRLYEISDQGSWEDLRPVFKEAWLGTVKADMEMKAIRDD